MIATLPKYAKPKKVKSVMKEKIYKPKPHPRQADMDASNAIKSLVTGGK